MHLAIFPCHNFSTFLFVTNCIVLLKGDSNQWHNAVPGGFQCSAWGAPPSGHVFHGGVPKTHCCHHVWGHKASKAHTNLWNKCQGAGGCHLVCRHQQPPTIIDMIWPISFLFLAVVFPLTIGETELCQYFQKALRGLPSTLYCVWVLIGVEFFPGVPVAMDATVGEEHVVSWISGPTPWYGEWWAAQPNCSCV